MTAIFFFDLKVHNATQQSFSAVSILSQIIGISS